MADLGFGHIKAGNARTGSRGRSAGLTFEGGDAIASFEQTR